MRAGSQSAYVLHRYDWSETSLIVDLYTRDLGRLAVAAKGAKRPYSQLRPVLLPFQRLNVSLGRATRGGDEQPVDVQNLRSAEWAGGLAPLRGEALFAGFYLNELLLKLLARHDAHPVLWDAYADTLAVLAAATGAAESEAALRAFELVLLREIGLLPDLTTVTLTLAPVQPAQSYALRAESGVVAAIGDDTVLAGTDLLRVQAAITAGDLPALRRACGSALAPLRTQLRLLLHYHLGMPQLRTRQVMLDAQRLADSPRLLRPTP